MPVVPWRRWWAVGYLVILFGVLVVVLWPRSGGPQRLVIFAADSLTRSFGQLQAEFERTHLGVTVESSFDGSVALVRLAPERRPDVLAVADARLIPDQLVPTQTDWWMLFATNEIVLAATERSKYLADISPENWFEIILRPDVKFGYGNPAVDPCGYWTLLCWKLADLHYAGKLGPGRLYDQLTQKASREDVAEDTRKLLARMQTASGIDYGFVYRSQAEDRNLPYVSLPPQINLGDPAMQQRYESVEVDVPRGDKTVRIRGGLIAFALTTIRGSENEPLAREFVKLVLSERGRQILRDCRLKVLDPPIVPKGVKLPGYLDGQAEVR